MRFIHGILHTPLPDATSFDVLSKVCYEASSVCFDTG